MNDIQEDFGGVFYFTNPTDKERKYLWNNKEYTFPPEATVPLIIMGEPLENVQEIRKRFAYRMAEERFYEGAQYKKMKEMGNGIPPTFDTKILEPMIEECLKPLAIKKATIKEAKPEDLKFSRVTKAIGSSGDLGSVFKEEMQNPQTFGEMSK
jgi:hypothetical protein